MLLIQIKSPYTKAGSHLIWCGCPRHIVQGPQKGHGRVEKRGEVVCGQPQGKREHAQQAEAQRQHRAKIRLCGPPIPREQVLSRGSNLFSTELPSGARTLRRGLCPIITLDNSRMSFARERCYEPSITQSIQLWARTR